MSTPTGSDAIGPIALRTAIGAITATVGLVIAVLMDALPVAAAIIAALSAAIAMASVAAVRRIDDKWAIASAGIVLGSVIVVGIPTVAVVDSVLGNDTAASSNQVAGPVPHDDADTAPIYSSDPTEAMKRAVRRADELLPNGSQSLISIEIRDDRESVRILDPATGNELWSYRSSSGWDTPSPSPSTVRKTFSATDITTLDLTATVPKVQAARQHIGLSPTSSYASDAITIGLRSSDDLLVASFSEGGYEIEADAKGAIAETLDAGSLEKFTGVAMSVMRHNKLNPSVTNMREITFETIKSSKSSAGFELTLAKGLISRITVKPGQFPEVSRTSAGNSGGFAIAKLDPGVFPKVRADVMARYRLPAYDSDRVEMTIGEAPGDHNLDATPVSVIMGVGPQAHQNSAIYFVDGEYRRDGTW